MPHVVSDVLLRRVPLIKPPHFQPGLRSPDPELGILPGAGSGAQIKNQPDLEPELSLEFKTGAGAIAI